jgi:8-oxo-dGTP pyrophosphatase MutT (NUDIX family)
MKDSFPEALIKGKTRLPVGNASAAIIILDDGRYLLQLRDELEFIWYPGHWGCFGGGVEQGEDALEALKRELKEELGFECTEANFFIEIDFDLSGLNHGRYYRKYYVIHMSLAEMNQLCLGEGKAVEAFDGDSVLGRLEVTPYDAFALFLHARSYRFLRDQQ